METDESSVLDFAYRTVADQRRRQVLTYLRETSAESSELDDLVDHVGQQAPDSPDPDRESVRIDLYHVHLPLLNDTGAIDFDSRTETVRYQNGSALETLLDGEFRRHGDERNAEG